MSHEDKLDALLEMVRELKADLKAIDAKLNDAIKVQAKHETDIGWVKGTSKIVLTVLLPALISMVIAILEVFKK